MPPRGGARYGQDRAARVLHDPAGDGAQHPAVEPAAPVGPHDDEIGRALARLLEDFVGRIAFHEDELRRLRPAARADAVAASRSADTRVRVAASRGSPDGKYGTSPAITTMNGETWRTTSSAPCVRARAVACSSARRENSEKSVGQRTRRIFMTASRRMGRGR